jgi:hypothetical protein
MQNRKTPPVSGALPSAISIRVYSDNKRMTTQEMFLMDYALTHPETDHDSDELTKLRRQVKAYHLATDHLLQERLSPIVPSLHYQALKKGA